MMLCSQIRQNVLLNQIGFWLMELNLCDTHLEIYSLWATDCGTDHTRHYVKHIFQYFYSISKQQIAFKKRFTILYLLFFSVSDAICELAHRKKLMHAGSAEAMDRHALSQCTNGVWLQCLYVRSLVVGVSWYYWVIAFYENLNTRFNFGNESSTTKNEKWALPSLKLTTCLKKDLQFQNIHNINSK